MEENDSVTEIIGWVATQYDGNFDQSLLKLCTFLGNIGYNFFSYPIGGVVRSSYYPQKNSKPPPIFLPDLQMDANVWSTYVIGRVSSWIDCDSDVEWIADLSCRELKKELAFAMYLPIRILGIELKHWNSPRLAEIINKWLWTMNMSFCIWVYLPTDKSSLKRSELINTDKDVWEIWVDFRTSCSNFPPTKLAVGLKIGADIDDEFINENLMKRWRTEQLASIWVETSAFISGTKSDESALPISHQCLFLKLFSSLSQRPLICPSDIGAVNSQLRKQYVDAIRGLMKKKIYQSQKVSPGGDILFEYLGHREYIDSLQIPLQPLADDLDSGTYSIFEEDEVKYSKYRDAISSALFDLVKIVGEQRPIFVFLLGAGRGPLMQMIIDAEKQYNDKNSKSEMLNLSLIAVEKNSNAIVTLNYRNQFQWMNRVTIIESDMRDLVGLVERGEISRADLIVSELLGSFGDNELCPECLDGITDILQPTAISIPSSYTSYIVPIQSVQMHQKIVASSGNRYFERGLPGRGRASPQLLQDGTYQLPKCDDLSPFDEIYVVCLRSICFLSEPQSLFTFVHPNFEKTTNWRKKILEFEIDIQSELMGFAGYFEAHLYGDHWISTLPSSHTPLMFSWFPALIPLRNLIRLQKGTKVSFTMERKIDDNGVWYEWLIDYEDLKTKKRLKTVLQNENGISYYMRL